MRFLRRTRRTTVTRLALAAALVASTAALAPAASAGTGQGDRQATTSVADVHSADVRPAAADRQGLLGEYYETAGPDFGFDTAVGSTIDHSLDVDDLVSTLQAFGGRAENVAVRWTGQITAEYAEDYTFSISADNGFRLWVDGQMVLDHWVNDWDVEHTSEPITLPAGTPVDVELEYFQAVGGANLHVSWASASQPKQPVPDSALTVPADLQLVGGSATVDEAGTTITAELDDPVIDLGPDPAEQITVLAGGGLTPIDGVTVDPSDAHRLLISLPNPIVRRTAVRVDYDGQGDLASDSGPLARFSLQATNNSAYFMKTPWADDVDPDNVHGEYPRPQLTRDDWQNLNGRWQFEPTTADAAVPSGQDLSGSILVPFPMESALSGVEEHHDFSLYRRTFDVPQRWRVGKNQLLRLNFGAVDAEAWVYVNGTQVAHHRNGYDAFSVDVTDALQGTGPQELVLKVKDTTDGTLGSVGKQTSDPGGIWYTASSGIWQSVWMEPVPEASIDRLSIVPHVDDSSVTVTVHSEQQNRRAVVKVRDDDGTVAVRSAPVNQPVTLQIDSPHLWSPDDPFLYDLQVRLGSDVIGSYFGMRSISVDEVGGFSKIEVNGEPTYVLSTLDQGFWPDGLYTAPTDEALKFDLVQHKELGFNAVRKHIKVEPARWYYWADKLGLLVLQDMPSGSHPDQASRDRFVADLHDEVVQLGNHPSIVAWVPFNEGWGEWDRTATGEIADQVKEWDPSRLVNAHSGVNCCASHGDSGRGDIIDWHMYTGPAFPSPDDHRAAMDGEHGGFSLTIPGHTWSGASANPYGEVEDSEALTEAYVQNTERLIPAASCNLSGSVYTQITDVETEMNGIWTYDRKVEKMDPQAVREVNERVLAAGAAAGGTNIPPGTPGLTGVGWWPLDGDTADASGNGHDATAPNGVTFGEGPDGAQAAVFDGDDQFLDAGGPVLDTTTGNYSVSAWVRLDSKDGFATAVGIDGTATSTFFLQYAAENDRFAFSFAGSRALAQTVGSPEVGRWYHLVGTYDHADSTLRIYVDGEQAGSVKACATDIPAGNLTIGRGLYNGDPVDFWTGGIAAVHAYDRALSADEVAQLATGEPTG